MNLISRDEKHLISIEFPDNQTENDDGTSFFSTNVFGSQKKPSNYHEFL